MASQLIEEVTAHAQSDSLEDAREICADGTYFPNNVSMYFIILFFLFIILLFFIIHMILCIISTTEHYLFSSHLYQYIPIYINLYILIDMIYLIYIY